MVKSDFIAFYSDQWLISVRFGISVLTHSVVIMNSSMKHDMTTNEPLLWLEVDHGKLWYAACPRNKCSTYMLPVDPERKDIYIYNVLICLEWNIHLLSCSMWAIKIHQNATLWWVLHWLVIEVRGFFSNLQCTIRLSSPKNPFKKPSGNSHLIYSFLPGDI